MLQFLVAQEVKHEWSSSVRNQHQQFTRVFGAGLIARVANHLSGGHPDQSLVPRERTSFQQGTELVLAELLVRLFKQGAQ